MSLGIFSFDLAAIIGGLSNLIDVSAPEIQPVSDTASLAEPEGVLQNATAESFIDDRLTAKALNGASTSLISFAENIKKTEDKIKPPLVRVPTVNPDEETRKEIERLIKSLQTSVIHNYRSSDIIDEAVALKTVADFPRRKFSQNITDEKETDSEQRKNEERKLKMLREQLRKAILKNNSVR